MKTLALLLISISSAFAGNYSINGLAFNEATILTQHKEYRTSNYSAACEIKIYLKKNKGFFSKSIITKNSRKAICADLTSSSIANFVSSNSQSALSSLLMNLGNRQWTENNPDMGDDSGENELDCKIYVDNIQDKALGNLCYTASETQGSFSTSND